MRQLENTLKIKDSSFIYTPEGMYFSERLAYNIVEEVESEDDKKSGFMSKFKEKFSKRKKNQYAKDDEEST